MDVTSAARSAASQITAGYLREAVTQLASDAFEGRGPATPGDQKTRAYLADRLKDLGYQPGGPGGQWEQFFDIVGVTAAVQPRWRFTGKATSVNLRVRDDFIAASGVQAPTASVRDAEVVFVGYGIEAPEYQWDDFKGIDVRGKVLLMLNNDPDWDAQLFEGVRRLYYGRWTYKYESAARHGAAGAIIVHTNASAGYPWQVVQTSWSGEQFDLPSEGEPRVQIQAWATEESTRRLLATLGTQPRFAGGRGAVTRLHAGASWHSYVAHPHQHAVEGADGQRGWRDARQRPGVERPGRHLLGPPRSSGHRPTRWRRRPDLQRRDGQRGRLRTGAGDRARLRGAAGEAAAFDSDSVRGRGRAGADRFASTTHVTRRSLREGSRRTSTMTAATSGGAQGT